MFVPRFVPQLVPPLNIKKQYVTENLVPRLVPLHSK